jgi:dCMP deaminase
MKLRQLKAYMKAAYVFADLSYCERKKVGFVLVKDDRIISVGYNGTPPGEDNCCEHTIVTDSGDSLLVTNPNVIHAEINALKKLEKSPDKITDETVGFGTTAPCVNCARRIVEDGLKIVYYDEVYRSAEGIELLLDHGVKVNQITP